MAEKSSEHIDDVSAGLRRFSSRKRKPVDMLSFDKPLRKKKKSKSKKQEKQTSEGIELKKEFSSSSTFSSSIPRCPSHLQVGSEIVLNCGVKENPSFNGEVFVIKAINDGMYVLEMANPCFDLWGGPICKSAAFMDRYVALKSAGRPHTSHAKPTLTPTM